MKRMIKGLVTGTQTHLDGLIVYLDTWAYDNQKYWHLWSWDKKDDEQVMQFMHNQDELYQDMPIDEFRELWTSSEYELECSCCIDKINVEIIEEIETESKE